MKKLFLIFFVFTFALQMGCSSVEKEPAEQTSVPEETTTSELADQIPPVLSSEELDSIKADESGEIMVLMYHNIGSQEDTWVRTPENFKRDLETLYNQGFRAISLEDYVDGSISTEKGYTPIVFTFDDGNENNFRLIDSNGEKILDPNCALGIMEAFKEEHPDFNMTATFFLNQLGFGNKGQEKEKFEYLISNGYSIGNHTLTHPNLKKLSPDEIQKEIASLKATHEKTYSNMDINTIALPFGSKPSEENQYNLTYQGTYDGVSYENKAVLWVGWDPYFSPYHSDFDFSRIHRVRASETDVDDVGLYNYLSAYEKGVRNKYISDGNPKTIAIPEEKIELIAIDRFPQLELLTY